MSINWTRLVPGESTYGTSYILRELDPEDLRQVILKYAGVLPPEDCSRDKMSDWAGYLFEGAHMKAVGRVWSESFTRRYRHATKHWTPAMDGYWARQAAKAKVAFAKMAARPEPSPTSAQALSWKMLDEHGEEMDARSLMKAIFKKHGKRIGLNTARSYMSGWRKRNKAKGGDK